MYEKWMEQFPTLAYLTISGSRAYGTNNEHSDLDLRGFYFETKEQIFSLTPYKTEYVDEETDTTLYSFKQFVYLLSKCNPNVIELLGTRGNEVQVTSDIANEMRNNYEMFLSKRAYKTFAEYANQQLRRLQNAVYGHDNEFKEQHILNSLKREISNNQKELSVIGEYQLDLKEDEIAVSLNVKDIPLRKFLIANTILNNTLRNYNKIGHRNRKKDDNHLYKHAMHLVRLYYMGIDILEKGEINTYRDKEHDLLMSIRNGEMSFDNVFELKDKLEVQLDKSLENSKLPDEVDMNKINNFVIETFERIW